MLKKILFLISFFFISVTSVFASKMEYSLAIPWEYSGHFFSVDFGLSFAYPILDTGIYVGGDLEVNYASLKDKKNSYKEEVAEKVYGTATIDCYKVFKIVDFFDIAATTSFGYFGGSVGGGVGYDLRFHSSYDSYDHDYVGIVFGQKFGCKLNDPFTKDFKFVDKFKIALFWSLGSKKL